MAVIKAVSSKAGIGQALDYVTKEEKTEDKLVSGLHCEPDTVKDEMQATKELWGKTGGRTYKHFVQSYHEDEHITPEQAHKNAVELAKGTEAWKGHEVLIATHIDRGHIHSHFIVNSVNYEDGHKLQWSKKDLAELKDRCNEQSRQQGLYIPEKGKTFSGEEREETVAWNKETYNLLKQAEKGEVKSYVQDIALAIMDCREQAQSREEFINQMNERGYGVDWQDSHKYITFTDLARQEQGEKQCKVRNNKLEKYYAVDFGKESLEHGFEINARKEAERTDTTERARQQLDRTAVAEDSRIGKAYQPDNTSITEERLASLRSHNPSRGMEEPSREIQNGNRETQYRERQAQCGKRETERREQQAQSRESVPTPQANEPANEPIKKKPQDVAKAHVQANKATIKIRFWVRYEKLERFNEIRKANSIEIYKLSRRADLDENGKINFECHIKAEKAELFRMCLEQTEKEYKEEVAKYKIIPKDSLNHSEKKGKHSLEDIEKELKDKKQEIEKEKEKRGEKVKTRTQER